ncbi:MAG: transglutaminase domain-containing protein [Deltaproteobacteria bacterium]|nr:transglutaminase domain-containing protein [Deltaproteobacteria bacterium]
MNTPPFLTGAALIYWGWQTGLLVPAALAATVTELHRMTRWRITLDDRGFSNVIMLCNILIAATALFAYTWEGKAGSFLKVISWFPLILLPIVLAQLYSTAGTINPDIFFIFLKKNREKKRKPFLISITYPYLAVCLLSASVANVRSLLTYAFMVIICGWALYCVKPSRSPAITWMIIFIVLAGAGYYGSVALHGLHKKTEEKFIQWYSGTFMKSNDYQRTTTSLGQLGKRKSSGEIIFRVKNDSQKRSAFHLVESSYDSFRSPSWFALLAPMKALKGKAGKSKWKLSHVTGGDGNLITIFKSLQEGKNILPLPPHARAIENLPVNELFRNRMGAVMSEHDSLFAAYHVSSTDDGNTVDVPTGRDLAIPRGYTPLIAQVAKGIGLKSKKHDQIAESLSGFFLSNFTYSLDAESSEEASLPLEDFLLKSRSGHCEYFATATALLLRWAGIPARYTVGYLVHEYSEREAMYVVRERDAHAWVTAYIDGKWLIIDTTPPSWVAADSQQGSFMEPLSDLRAYLQFLIARWRASEENFFTKYGYVLLLLLLWRLFGKKNISLVYRKKEAAAREESRPIESPFYALEKKLKEAGHIRHKGETYRAWFKRMEEEERPITSVDIIKSALLIHTKMRFRREGISHNERAEMERLVATWMREGQGNDN